MQVALAATVDRGAALAGAAVGELGEEVKKKKKKKLPLAWHTAVLQKLCTFPCQRKDMLQVAQQALEAATTEALAVTLGTVRGADSTEPAVQV